MLLVLLVRSMMGVMLVMGGGHHRLDHGARQHQRGQGSSKQVANPHGEGLLSTRETPRTRGRLTAAPAAIAAAGRAPADRSPPEDAEPPAPARAEAAPHPLRRPSSPCGGACSACGACRGRGTCTCGAYGTPRDACDASLPSRAGPGCTPAS